MNVVIALLLESICDGVCVAFSARCHLLQAQPKTATLADILIGSTLLAGEDGMPISMGPGYDFNMDPLTVDDPELAMVSCHMGCGQV